MKEMNVEEVRKASEYVEKFADSTEKDFALAHLDSFLSRYGHCLAAQYDPIQNKLHIWADYDSELYENWSDVETPEEIQEIWIDWCRNV